MSFFGYHDISFHATLMYQCHPKLLHFALGVFDKPAVKWVKRVERKFTTRAVVKVLRLLKFSIENGKKTLSQNNVISEVCLSEKDKKNCDREINNLKRNCFTRINILKRLQRGPTDWTAMTLLIIGSSQLVIGAALTVFAAGSGSFFAGGIISAGISDIVTAGDRYCTAARDFRWRYWVATKLVSFTISLAFYESQIINLKNIRSVFFTQIVKTGWKIVANKIAIQLGKDVINEVAPNMLNPSFRIIEPAIIKKITEMIELPIQEALLNNPVFEKLLKLDKKNKDDTNEIFIKTTAMNILDSKNNLPLLLALQVTSALAENKGKGFFYDRKVIEALGALSELHKFVPEFIEKINHSLIIYEKNINDQINSQKKDLNFSSSVTGKNKSTKFLVEDNNENQNDDINVKIHLEIQEKSRRIAKEIISNVSIKILSIVKDKLIWPVIQISVSTCVAMFTSSLDKSLEKQIESYQALTRVIKLQNAGFKRLHKVNVNNNYQPADKYFVGKIESLIKYAKSGPCGLPHLGALSDIVSKTIRIYDEKERLKYIIGDEKIGEPINIQYHTPELGECIGHFTLLGGEEPVMKDEGENMCLFNTIAFQTGIEPHQMKSDMLTFMKLHKTEISKQSEDIIRLEMEPNFALNLGGASYRGSSPADAGRYLDDSQGVAGFAHSAPGHPRGHASDPTKAANVENYSRSSYKSGFDSYEAQDIVTHNALRTHKAREAMDMLNHYDPSSNNGERYTRQVIDITEDDFRASGLELPDTATGGQWVRGEKTSSWNVGTVTVVLQHHRGRETDPDAPVHIQTIYPRNR